MSSAPEQGREDTNARQIHAEAAAWIERRESSTWNDAERTEFETWLSKSVAHTVAFLRAEDVWRRADRLRALGRPERRPISRSRRAVFAKVGAAGIVLTVLGVLGGQFYRAPTLSSYATPIGGREVLTLKDGTRIELNTNTALRVAINRSERKVWLDRGEAFFDVRHNAKLPFVVIARNRRVIDLGTKFLARTSSARLEVALVEGSARVESDGANKKTNSAVLTSGDVAFATDDAVSITTKPVATLTKELGWRRGVLIFDRTSLADAVADFNRYNQQQLVIADSALGFKKIDGTFRATDEDAFLEAMHDLVGLSIKRSNGEVIISRQVN